MKVCISEFTYLAFEKELNEAFKGHEFLLIDKESNLIEGDGKPDVALVSYELMFRAFKES